MHLVFSNILCKLSMDCVDCTDYVNEVYLKDFQLYLPEILQHTLTNWVRRMSGKMGEIECGARRKAELIL